MRNRYLVAHFFVNMKRADSNAFWSFLFLLAGQYDECANSPGAMAGCLKHAGAFEESLAQELPANSAKAADLLNSYSSSLILKLLTSTPGGLYGEHETIFWREIASLQILRSAYGEFKQIW